MKLTKQRLKEMIKEELSSVLKEITPAERAEWAEMKAGSASPAIAAALEKRKPEIEGIKKKLPNLKRELANLRKKVSRYGRSGYEVNPWMRQQDSALEGKIDHLETRLRQLTTGLRAEPRQGQHETGVAYGSPHDYLESPYRDAAAAMGIDPEYTDMTPSQRRRLHRTGLKEMIKEELSSVLKEYHDPLDPHTGGRNPTPEVQSVFDEAGLTPEEVIEVQSVLSGDEIDWMNTQSYEKLYQYYAFGGRGMPYGVAKARDGDPVDWILDQLEEMGA